MDFVIQWLGCVVGFVAGSGVGWGAVRLLIKSTSPEEALAAAHDSPEIGAQ
jgi:hypothetical protein